MDNFPAWLRGELEARHWKQADLARASNLDTAVISNLINSKRGPGEDTCNAIARAFGYSPDVVFRAAGLLPPVRDDVQATIERWTLLFTELTDDDLREMYELGQLKLERRRRNQDEQKKRPRDTGSLRPIDENNPKKP